MNTTKNNLYSYHSIRCSNQSNDVFHRKFLTIKKDGISYKKNNEYRLNK